MEFIGIIATAILTGIGGAMAWFRSQRKDINVDIEAIRVLANSGLEDIRAEMRCQMDDNHNNDRDIAVLKTEIRNNVKQLDEISDATKQTNQKLDKLAEMVTTTLLAVNRTRH